MPPITWKTIQSNADYAGASDILGEAGRSITSGLNRIGAGLTGYAEEQKKQARDRFMNQINQYQTSDELQNAIESGAIRDLEASLGSFANAQTNAAARNRFGVLSNYEQQVFDQDQDVAQRAASPIVQELERLRAIGDIPEATKFAQDNAQILTDAGYFGRAAQRTKDAQEAIEDRDYTKFQEGEARGIAARSQQARDRQKAALGFASQFASSYNPIDIDSSKTAYSNFNEALDGIEGLTAEERAAHVANFDAQMLGKGGIGAVAEEGLLREQRSIQGSIDKGPFAGVQGRNVQEEIDTMLSDLKKDPKFAKNFGGIFGDGDVMYQKLTEWMEKGVPKATKYGVQRIPISTARLKNILSTVDYDIGAMDIGELEDRVIEAATNEDMVKNYITYDKQLQQLEDINRGLNSKVGSTKQKAIEAEAKLVEAAKNSKTKFTGENKKIASNMIKRFEKELKELRNESGGTQSEQLNRMSTIKDKEEKLFKLKAANK